jgi:2-methylcitrate dehydratase
MSEKKSDAHKVTAVRALARWILSIDSASLPAAEITQAKLLLLDSIGCGFAGRHEEASYGVIAACKNLQSTGPCTIIGEAGTTDMAHAALANGTLIRVIDLNDYVVVVGKNGPSIGGHPSDNIPVALAAGQARKRSGLDILAAIVLGYEVFGRVKGLMDRKTPWDGVSVSAFAAAGMAGRLIGLNDDRMAHALALSGMSAPTPALVRRGGLSAAKSIANALIAQRAIEAALLAEQGLTGPMAIIEHEDGLHHVFPNGDPMAAFTVPLPAQSYIMGSNVKAYPCLATGQSAVAAGVKLHPSIKGGVESLKRIEVVMADYPIVHRQQHDPGRAKPHSRESADHSFQFLVAAALTDGVFGLAQYENERWRDPAFIALMDRMVMTTDATLNERAPGTYPCVVRVVDQNDKTHSAEVLFPPGYSNGGIAEAEVVEKFHATTSMLDKSRRDRIVAAVLGLDRAPNADAVTATLGA